MPQISEIRGRDQTSSLLALPWELRSVIFLLVLKHRPPKAPTPIFDSKFIKNSVRVRNRFDANFPEDTNIYVQKPKHRYFRGYGLLATCRQLHHDLTALLHEDRRTEQTDKPVVLDVMFVKDVGIFPTWISFPYRTKRILNLRIDMRIVRPDPKLIPKEWIEMGRHKRHSWSRYRTEPSEWNLLTVISLYVLGRLSLRSSRDEMPLGNQQSAANGTMQRGTRKKHDKHAVQLNSGISNYKNSIVEAHVVPFESTPYVVDDLHIDFHRFEYDAAGKAIMPTEKDEAKRRKLGEFWFMSKDAISPRLADRAEDSQFYREGYVQFGRNIFIDSSMLYQDSMSDLEENALLGASGALAAYLLQDCLWDGFEPIRFSHYDCRFALCYSVLANTVGEVTMSTAMDRPDTVIFKNTNEWVEPWSEDPDPLHEEKIKREVAEEEAKERPDQARLARMRTACRRIALGWQAQYEEQYKGLQ